MDDQNMTPSGKRSDRDPRKSRATSSHALDDQNPALPQNQFPGEIPSTYAEPYRPPGLASHYYGDQGQSVAFQPGVRPAQPSIVTNSEQAHLMEPTLDPRPPAEPSSLGQLGAAASYFDDSSYQNTPAGPSTPSNPLNPSSRPDGQGQPGVSPRTSPGPIKHSSQPSHSSSTVPLPASLGEASSYYSPGNFTTPQRPPASDFLASGSHPDPLRPHGSSPATSAVPLYGALAAGAAVTGVAHSLHQHQQHSPGYPSAPPNASYNPAYTQMQHRPQHKHRSPLGKLVDWFRDPQAVAEFEQYTEAIGVCKYCFDPRSSAADAPRKHHYPPRRRSSGSRYGSTDRVDKAYRASSDEERRKRSKSKNVAVGGVAAYGAAKLGNAVLKANHDFDDTYSVKTGRAFNQSRVSFQDHPTHQHHDRRRSPSSDHGKHAHDQRKQSRSEKGSRRHERHSAARRGSSSSESSRGISRRAAAIGVASAIPVTLALGHKTASRNRSRSHSPPSRTPYDHVSPAYSYVDLSATNADSGGILGFFTSPSANKKKGKASKGFFNFANSSSSSTDLDLGYGAGTVRRRRSSRRLSDRDKNLSTAAGVAGLLKLGNDLASESDRRRRKGKPRDYTNYGTGRQASRRLASGGKQDDEWYDIDDSSDNGQHLRHGANGGNIAAHTKNERPEFPRDTMRQVDMRENRNRGKGNTHFEYDDTPSSLRQMEPRPISETASTPLVGSQAAQHNAESPFSQPRHVVSTSVPLQQPQPISTVRPFIDQSNSASLETELSSPRNYREGKSPSTRARDREYYQPDRPNTRTRSRRDSSPAKLSSQARPEEPNFNVSDQDRQEPGGRGKESGGASERKPKDRRKSADAALALGAAAVMTGALVSRSDASNSDNRNLPKASRDRSYSPNGREAEIERQLQALYDEQRKGRERKSLPQVAERPTSVADADGAVSKTSTSGNIASNETTTPPQRRSSSKKAPEQADSPPQETQQQRIARMAAQRVKSTPSPVHEDYSTFFLPKELAEHLKEHNDQAEHRDDLQATFLEITPGSSRAKSKYQFDPFLYRQFGLHPDDDPMLHPWPVPWLGLIEATPPGSRAHSDRGEPSPINPAPPSEHSPETGEQLERKAGTATKETWAEPETSVYEAETQEYGRLDHVPDQSSPHGEEPQTTERGPDKSRPDTDNVPRPEVGRTWTLDDSEADLLEKKIPTITDRPEISRAWTLEEEEADNLDNDQAPGKRNGFDVVSPQIVEISPRIRNSSSPKIGSSAIEHRTSDQGQTPQAIYQSPFAETISDLGIVNEQQDAPGDTSAWPATEGSNNTREVNRKPSLDERATSGTPSSPKEHSFASATNASMSKTTEISPISETPNVLEYLVTDDKQTSIPPGPDAAVVATAVLASGALKQSFTPASQRDDTTSEGNAPSLADKHQRPSTFDTTKLERSEEQDVPEVRPDPGVSERSRTTKNKNDAASKRSKAGGGQDKKSRRKSKRDSRIFNDDDHEQDSAKYSSMSPERNGEATGQSLPDDPLGNAAKSNKDNARTQSHIRPSEVDSASEPLDEMIISRDPSVDDGFVSADDNIDSRPPTIEGDESFLGIRPEMPQPTDKEMPMGTDGVSGPVITGGADSSRRGPAETRNQQFGVSPDDLDDAIMLSSKEADDLMEDPSGKTPLRRLSAIRTGGNLSTPATPSNAIAIPVQFRLPVSSPTNARFTLSSPIASPHSPLTTPRTRQGRPRSTEFTGKDIRPLYLVERSNFAKSSSPVVADYPPLPASIASSSQPSIEDLRAEAQAQEHAYSLTPTRISADLFRERTRRHSYSHWDDEDRRPQSPDYLDSRSATPVPGETQRAHDSHKKPKPKYEFHSPSELLQDPSVLYANPDIDGDIRSASPLPSIISTEADQDYMSARSRSQSPPLRARSVSRGRRSASESRSTSASWQDALSTITIGAAAASALALSLQQDSSETGTPQSNQDVSTSAKAPPGPSPLPTTVVGPPSNIRQADTGGAFLDADSSANELASHPISPSSLEASSASVDIATDIENPPVAASKTAKKQRKKEKKKKNRDSLLAQAETAIETPDPDTPDKSRASQATDPLSGDSSGDFLEAEQPSTFRTTSGQTSDDVFSSAGDTQLSNNDSGPQLQESSERLAAKTAGGSALEQAFEAAVRARGLNVDMIFSDALSSFKAEASCEQADSARLPLSTIEEESEYPTPMSGNPPDGEHVIEYSSTKDVRKENPLSDGPHSPLALSVTTLPPLDLHEHAPDRLPESVATGEAHPTVADPSQICGAEDFEPSPVEDGVEPSSRTRAYDIGAGSGAPLNVQPGEISSTSVQTQDAGLDDASDNFAESPDTIANKESEILKGSGPGILHPHSRADPGVGSFSSGEATELVPGPLENDQSGNDLTSDKPEVFLPRQAPLIGSLDDGAETARVIIETEDTWPSGSAKLRKKQKKKNRRKGVTIEDDIDPKEVTQESNGDFFPQAAIEIADGRLPLNYLEDPEIPSPQHPMKGPEDLSTDAPSPAQTSTDLPPNSQTQIDKDIPESQLEIVKKMTPSKLDTEQQDNTPPFTVPPVAGAGSAGIGPSPSGDPVDDTAKVTNFEQVLLETRSHDDAAGQEISTTRHISITPSAPDHSSDLGADVSLTSPTAATTEPTSSGQMLEQTLPDQEANIDDLDELFPVKTKKPKKNKKNQRVTSLDALALGSGKADAEEIYQPLDESTIAPLPESTPQNDDDFVQPKTKKSKKDKKKSKVRTEEPFAEEATPDTNRISVEPVNTFTETQVQEGEFFEDIGDNEKAKTRKKKRVSKASKTDSLVEGFETRDDPNPSVELSQVTEVAPGVDLDDAATIASAQASEHDRETTRRVNVFEDSVTLLGNASKLGQGVAPEVYDPPSPNLESVSSIAESGQKDPTTPDRSMEDALGSAPGLLGSSTNNSLGGETGRAAITSHEQWETNIDPTVETFPPTHPLGAASVEQEVKPEGAAPQLEEVAGSHSQKPDELFPQTIDNLKDIAFTADTPSALDTAGGLMGDVRDQQSILLPAGLVATKDATEQPRSAQDSSNVGSDVAEASVEAEELGLQGPASMQEEQDQQRQNVEEGIHEADAIGIVPDLAGALADTTVEGDDLVTWPVKTKKSKKNKKKEKAWIAEVQEAVVPDSQMQTASMTEPATVSPGIAVSKAADELQIASQTDIPIVGAFSGQDETQADESWAGRSKKKSKKEKKKRQTLDIDYEIPLGGKEQEPIPHPESQLPDPLEGSQTKSKTILVSDDQENENVPDPPLADENDGTQNDANLESQKLVDNPVEDDHMEQVASEHIGNLSDNNDHVKVGTTQQDATHTDAISDALDQILLDPGPELGFEGAGLDESLDSPDRESSPIFSYESTAVPTPMKGEVEAPRTDGASGEMWDRRSKKDKKRNRKATTFPSDFLSDSLPDQALNTAVAAPETMTVKGPPQPNSSFEDAEEQLWPTVKRSKKEKKKLRKSTFLGALDVVEQGDSTKGESEDAQEQQASPDSDPPATATADDLAALQGTLVNNELGENEKVDISIENEAATEQSREQEEDRLAVDAGRAGSAGEEPTIDSHRHSESAFAFANPPAESNIDDEWGVPKRSKKDKKKKKQAVAHVVGMTEMDTPSPTNDRKSDPSPAADIEGSIQLHTSEPTTAIVGLIDDNVEDEWSVKKKSKKDRKKQRQTRLDFDTKEEVAADNRHDENLTKSIPDSTQLTVNDNSSEKYVNETEAIGNMTKGQAIIKADDVGLEYGDEATLESSRGPAQFDPDLATSDGNEHREGDTAIHNEISQLREAPIEDQHFAIQENTTGVGSTGKAQSAGNSRDQILDEPADLQSELQWKEITHDASPGVLGRELTENTDNVEPQRDHALDTTEQAMMQPRSPQFESVETLERPDAGDSGQVFDEARVDRYHNLPETSILAMEAQEPTMLSSGIELNPSVPNAAETVETAVQTVPLSGHHEENDAKSHGSSNGSLAVNSTQRQEAPSANMPGSYESMVQDTVKDEERPSTSATPFEPQQHNKQVDDEPVSSVKTHEDEGSPSPLTGRTINHDAMHESHGATVPLQSVQEPKQWKDETIPEEINVESYPKMSVVVEGVDDVEMNTPDILKDMGRPGRFGSDDDAAALGEGIGGLMTGEVPPGAPSPAEDTSNLSAAIAHDSQLPSKPPSSHTEMLQGMPAPRSKKQKRGKRKQVQLAWDAPNETASKDTEDLTKESDEHLGQARGLAGEASSLDVSPDNSAIVAEASAMENEVVVQRGNSNTEQGNKKSRRIFEYNGTENIKLDDAELADMSSVPDSSLMEAHGPHMSSDARQEHQLDTHDHASDPENSSDVSATTRERRKRRRSPQPLTEEEPEDLPGQRSLTPPPEHDDLMDTALGVAAGLGFGTSGGEASRSARPRSSSPERRKSSEWSFKRVGLADRLAHADNVRDSGVQFESPILADEHFTSQRDSGFGGVAHHLQGDDSQTGDMSLRPPRPQSPTSSIEDISESRGIGESKGEALHPFETPRRRPSPVDSTSKDRSSALFASSPAMASPSNHPIRSPSPPFTRDMRRESERDATGQGWTSSSSMLASNLIDRAAKVEVNPGLIDRPSAPTSASLNTIREDAAEPMNDMAIGGPALVAAMGLGAFAMSSRDVDGEGARGDPNHAKGLGRSKSRTTSLRNLRGTADFPSESTDTATVPDPLKTSINDNIGGAPTLLDRDMAEVYVSLTVASDGTFLQELND